LFLSKGKEVVCISWYTMQLVFNGKC